MKYIQSTKVVLGLALTSALALSSCSDDFLKEKTNFDQASPEIYNNYTGCLGRLSDCYALCLPDPNGSPNWQYTSVGKSDDLSKCTEEFAGFGVFVDPLNELNTISGIKEQPDYFQGADAANVRNNVWGLIRNINDAIQGIEGGTLSRGEKDQLVGQLYFLRAWRYFLLVKWYGGVPILTEVLDPVEGPGTPRSSARECFRFIFDDLDRAAAMLEAATAHGGWQNASDYGRITAGAALALKGRLMNLWASPLFNRANDPQRWTEAYEFQQQALAKIDACGHGLVDASEQTAAGWADLFVRSDRNPEAILLTIYNTNQGNSSTRKNAGWEQSIRPSNTDGGGGKQPSQLMIDLFPMSDGKLPAVYDAYDGLPTSAIAYDEACPWMNRDPRFYASIYYNGCQRNLNDPASLLYTHVGGNCGISDKATDVRFTRTGYYMRKFNNYKSNSANATDGFMPLFCLAELYLNFAEAAYQSAGPDQQVGGMSAREAVNIVRERVGMPGLPAGLSKADFERRYRKERRVELAFEDHRYYDVRRWKILEQTDRFVTGMKITKNNDGTFKYQRIRLADRKCSDAKFYLYPVNQTDVSKMLQISGQNWQNPGWE